MGPIIITQPVLTATARSLGSTGEVCCSQRPPLSSPNCGSNHHRNEHPLTEAPPRSRRSKRLAANKTLHAKTSIRVSNLYICLLHSSRGIINVKNDTDTSLFLPAKQTAHSHWLSLVASPGRSIFQQRLGSSQNNVTVHKYDEA